MLINVKGSIDPDHYDIVLAESLVNEKGDFYDLTFKQNFDELVGNEPYVANYQVRQLNGGTHTNRYVITKFLAWTKTKVIYLDDSIFSMDKLLNSLPRNPT